MDKGICFIINKCNFRSDLVKSIKSTLLKNEYTPLIAEELNSFNVDMLEHRILKPLKDAELVIVILSPSGNDKKDANFNVSFEFGYARAFDKNVILLFDGNLSELPADISRDYAISLEDPKLLSKIESLINVVEKKKVKRLNDLPIEINTLFAESINRNDFTTFSELLHEFSYTHNLLGSQELVQLILYILEGGSQKIASGQAAALFLEALNNIFTYDKSETSKKLNKYILKNLVYTLNNTTDISIAKQCLNLFIRTNNIEDIDYIIDFFKTKYPEKFENRLAFPLLEFGGKCSIEYCIAFLSKLTKEKNATELSKDKKDFLGSICKQLINIIKSQ